MVTNIQHSREVEKERALWTREIKKNLIEKAGKAWELSEI